MSAMSELDADGWVSAADLVPGDVVAVGGWRVEIVERAPDTSDVFGRRLMTLRSRVLGEGDWPNEYPRPTPRGATGNLTFGPGGIVQKVA